jgi:hypothetical protein
MNIHLIIIHRRVRSLRPLRAVGSILYEPEAIGHRARWRKPRKKILNNLCALRVLCGEILLENGIGFHV